MYCLDGLTTTLNRQFDRFFRFARSRSTSSRDKPATVQRQQIGVPRNVRKEEDPYSSLLALSTNDSDKAYLLHSKAKFSAARLNEISSSSSNITLPTGGGGGGGGGGTQILPPQPPQRSSSLAGTHQAKKQQQRQKNNVAAQQSSLTSGAGAGGEIGEGAGSRSSSRTGVSGRTAVAGCDNEEFEVAREGDNK